MTKPSFDLSSLLETQNSLETHGLIVERVGADLRANVTHVPCHSPSGYECGYSGSGPADLALAVLHTLIPPPAAAEEAKLYDLDHEDFLDADNDLSLWSVEAGPDKIRVNRLAYAIHQRFKSEFIATMPREGGFVAIDQIRAWIDNQKARISEEQSQ